MILDNKLYELNFMFALQEVSLAFKFMDLGSCIGGVNRRDTAIIFTLERQ